MIAAIHQPQYLPWLGYFDKMDQAGCFVLLDNVQYKRREWQNRNRIKTAGGVQWLTVPVSGEYLALINAVAVEQGENWRHKHLESLRHAYHRAACWPPAAASLEAFFGSSWAMLSQANAASIDWLRGQLGITTPLRWASEMAGLSEDPTGRLVDICRAVGADTYLSGVDGANYMDLGQFAAAGIGVIFQHYEHPVYPQLHGDFASHLSALDLVLNCGPRSLEILRSGRRNAT
ncbi:MAG: WbqC family protein [Candidatus Latescibacteria bacterium]|nr:WbqC family protein [Candidatus Latescibacterota bacterium]